MHIYSEKVLDHFQNPRNAGVVENANGVGEYGDEGCGDFLKVFLKVEDHTITGREVPDKGLPRVHCMCERHERACHGQESG